MKQLPERSKAFLQPQRIRIATGLVLFAFAFTHLLNHALGIVSIEWMDTMQAWRIAIWATLPGQILLYGSFVLHIVFGLAKLVRRRTWRMPKMEALQLIMALAIPYYLVGHIIATRGAIQMFGTRVDYVHELSVLWPGAAVAQTLMLIFVWVHSVLGLHYWLRHRRWYQRWYGVWLGFAAAFPVLATWGWVDAARRLELTELQSIDFTEDQFITILDLIGASYNWVLIVLGVGALVVAVINLSDRLKHRVTLDYPGGNKIKTPVGPTLLEISRSRGIPHASVCGGRARCSTCRTLIIEGEDTLEDPDPAERSVLARIGSPDHVRLACQIRPKADLTVQPLVPVRAGQATGAAGRDAYHWGVEQRVAIMFVDLRNFTGLSEKRLSFDVVFLLSRYLGDMAREIEAAGGYVDKFIGDGIMAIFGIDTDPRTACKQALDASARMGRALDEINEDLKSQVGTDLRIGVGIHAGLAILGRIGKPQDDGTQAGITALGDTVNTASRLETMTKEHGAVVMASERVCRLADVPTDRFAHANVSIRGRERPLTTVVISDFESLEMALKGEEKTPVEPQLAPV
ncbi:adenylate/guanylate cyclase domain-containing protein [Coralliovum pocilloporae]|uniref:adenylate/guanylate cyclase domain-containing protein n=1 Tax=Coralliovum pocilloporae TaxID=3066369 RepID=UPI00330780B5